MGMTWADAQQQNQPAPGGYRAKKMNAITIIIKSSQARPSLLTGLDPKYKFSREFLDESKRRSNKLREYVIAEPGIYHCKEPIETPTRRYGNYVRVTDSGEIIEITEADAVASFAK